MGTPSTAVMRAATAKATSGAALTPGCGGDQIGHGLALGPGMSSRNTFGIPGGALPRICRTSACCTRNTVSVNITPTPSATTAACAWLPGAVEVGDAVAHRAGQPRAGARAGNARRPRRNSQAASASRPARRPARGQSTRRCAAHRGSCLRSAWRPPPPVPSRIATRSRWAGRSPLPRPAAGAASASTSRRKISAGLDVANAQQRRQGEQQRHQAGDRDALQRRARRPTSAPTSMVK